MILVGNKSTFAFEIEESQIEDGNLCAVNIFIENQNICPFDNKAYLPASINSLSYTANYSKLNPQLINSKQRCRTKRFNQGTLQFISFRHSNQSHHDNHRQYAVLKKLQYLLYVA